MKKRFLSLLLAVLMVVTLAACASSNSGSGTTSGTASGSTSSSTKSIPLKIATYYADSHPTSVALAEVLKPMIDEGTEGRYTVELYGNNALGAEAEFNEGVKMGTIEGCITGNIMGDQFPALYASDFPWLFDDVEQSSVVNNDPKMKAIYQDAFDQCNMTLLGLSINGNRCISNNVHPINSLADLKGIKLRVPEAAHYVANFKALGATTVTMSLSEVFTALQQGTIEGQENPPTTLLTNGWYEVQPYLAITNHQISMNFVVLNTDFYNSMSEADQAVVQEACNAFVAKQLELYLKAMNDDLVTLEGKGVEITYPDRTEFKTAGSVVIDDYCTKYPEFATAVEQVRELQGA
ncbi:MAG: TRAP transporter substrate-binding protein [Oscillospiraceae bacterium]